MNYGIASTTDDQNKYINFVRCLASHKETANCTVGLDLNEILTFNFITSEESKTTAVFFRCYKRHANTILTCHVFNDQRGTILEPVPLFHVIDGHPMFDECVRPELIDKFPLMKNLDSSLS
ncbi:hypothetical protein BN7_5183 [Wickerhamomyces ciferrii]|uniref:Uncharacterized protein n=1 Tax=Wickerhamomyces ciferrii (strain ATCC 14091 / BCRC 22168 / CBS 111 / JCM 3599 / NBRC 0793 / NRRL Y-1031 F-60-10) TaxID=1206466 RepID=K0KK22_WICCF|nr:uncharacterized protein BN7_5183 [Wickerhamomyces ciferrii]CCH45600.1 hypothetical protein BN7_5183 [Wickerhamomyces ciferrii]